MEIGDGVIVMPSRESFEKLTFDELPDNGTIRDSRIDGIPVFWVEGGFANLYEEYLKTK